MNLLVCTATELEQELLRERVRTICTGVGPVNAAHALTVAVERQRPDAIVVCGIGGAYPGSALSVGEVVCAAKECYGDLGTEAPDGFLDMQTLGFPLVAASALLYNTLPLQLFPAARRVTFVTVSTCSGTEELARRMEARTEGAVENMEGAAIAHVAAIYGVPVGEIRGISNMVGDRRRDLWRVREAAAAAQEALLAWIATS